ncbi:MAG: hypothetical protein CMB81_04375 [Flammeovirgaceae bacterium]|jgi:hypothetical protein|nr:hypothetical protein [Flammeovirgaceae bacterium]
MLKNLSYKDPKIEKQINSLVGKEFSLIEKLKIKGTGSQKLYIKKCDNEIYDILRNDYELSICNIELRPKGIIIYLKSNLETYGLVIPYYKLIIFKVGDDDYTINADNYFLKIRIKNRSDHRFFKKVNSQKAIYLSDKNPE